MNYFQKLYEASKLNNNLCGKLFSPLESPTPFAELKLTSVQFFIPDFNLLSSELKEFMFKCYIESF